MAQLSRALAFFGPDIQTLEFPAWDCLPYDRVSPNASVVAQRMTALSRLARVKGRDKPSVLLTTVNAALQRVPARDFVATHALSVAPGNVIGMAGIIEWLELNGFTRASTVREPGDYAVRGGILDLFPPGMDMPVRLDFFGDALETIRTFDAQTQRSEAELRGLDLVPVAEFQLVTETIRRFRTGYVAQFGAAAPDDLLYEAVSEGRRYPGMEHWLPLFHDKTGDAVRLSARHAARARASGRGCRALRGSTQIADYYEARRASAEGRRDAALQAAAAGPALSHRKRMARRGSTAQALAKLTPFAVPEATGRDRHRRARRATTSPPSAPSPDANVFEAVSEHVLALQAAGKRVAIALWSEGARERMSHVLADHRLHNLTPVGSWPQALACPSPRSRSPCSASSPASRPTDAAIISEQDILGDRLVRPRRAMQRAENFIAEVTSLAPGDLVVHVDHGIGRFAGLQAIEAAGAPHDCLEIHYAEGAKLFLPVENVDLLSRYGSEESGVELDRLGGGNWQARKARMKSRIREIAGELIKIAAERQLREAPRLSVGPGAYDEFCAGFPYEETDDQLAAIEATIKDLGSGRPMDRLICGDVGFGKTEVALRAAFLAAISGKQVAVVVPTTLLARQHFKTFTERFRGFPVNVAQASRLVPAGEARRGQGGACRRQRRYRHRHACAARQGHQVQGPGAAGGRRGAAFRRRAQGKAQDAALAKCTCSRSPRRRSRAPCNWRSPACAICRSSPRRRSTGWRCAPSCRRSIRSPCARRCCARNIAAGRPSMSARASRTWPAQKDFLDKNVPEVRVAVAHGQMPPTVLDDIMSAFYDGKYDVLLSTTIIESGLDIPTANTLIVHRADRFGLAQLYQLRGRVGRAKLRAYALLTLPAQQKITPQAERRLKVLQSLDTLGAGFQLASHDLDIRGAGNLLGRGTVRPHQGSRLRALPADAGGGGDEPEGRHHRAGRRPLVAADHHRHAGAHSRRITSPICRCGSRSIGGWPRSRTSARSTAFAAELVDRFGKLPQRGRASAAGGGDQGAVPARQCREGRGRAEGRGARVPRQCLRQSGRADRLHPRARLGRAHAQRSEGRQEPAARVLRGLGTAGRAAQRHRRDFAQAGCASRSRQRRRSLCGGIRQDHVGAFFADHDGRGIGIAGHDRRHDRGIDRHREAASKPRTRSRSSVTASRRPVPCRQVLTGW